MRKMKFCLILMSVTFFLFCTPTFSEEINNPAFNTLAINEAGYKELYENQKEYNDRILSTIYWSLGGMAAIILALFGITSLFNYKINRRDLHEKINEVESRIQTEISKMMTEQLELKSKSVKDEFEVLSRNNSNKIEQNLLKMNQEVKYALVQIHDLEAEHWKQKEVWGNALLSYINSAQARKEVKLTLESVLGKILDILNQSTYLDSHNQKYYEELLKIIPDELSVIKRRIINRVDSMELR